MDRIKHFIKTSPFAYMIDTQNLTEIRKVGDRVKCTAYPASEGVRGQSITLGLIDEAASIAEQILTGTILYTLRRVGKRWIMLSTPKGYRGEFIKHYQLGMKSRPLCCTSTVVRDGKLVACGASFLQDDQIFKVVQHRFSGYTVPLGLPNCPACGGNRWVYGVGEYTIVEVDPWVCSWKTREEIQHELELAGNTPLARQEILGEIIMEGATVFSRELLERATNISLDNVPRPLPYVRNYVVGMDFGKTHDASVINVLHYDWQNHKCMWDYMESMGGQYQSGIDYHDIRERFLNIIKLYNPIWIVPDATGVGDSVMDEMYRDLRVLGTHGRIYSNKHDDPNAGGKRKGGMFTRKSHKGFIFSTQSKIDLINNLIEGYSKRAELSIPSYSVPEVRSFWDEMLAFSFDVTENKVLKYGTQSAHDDRVIAHALAYWACRQTPFIHCETKLGR